MQRILHVRELLGYLITRSMIFSVILRVNLKLLCCSFTDIMAGGEHIAGFTSFIQHFNWALKLLSKSTHVLLISCF
jgi:hypothetical protein